MAIRANHYDAAFEEYLREARVPYVAVDEQRRAVLEDATLKSMDFIVYAATGPNLLVDVKGRRFPSGGKRNRHKWENWATQDDVRSLTRWQEVFGEGFRAVLLFAYDIVEDALRADFEPGSLFTHGERTYAYYGVWIDEFREEMKQRSPEWETVDLSSAAYQRLRFPITVLWETVELETAASA